MYDSLDGWAGSLDANFAIAASNIAIAALPWARDTRQNASLSTMHRSNSGLHEVDSPREQILRMRFRAAYFEYLCAGAISGEHGARRVPVVDDPRSGPEHLLLGGSDVVRGPIRHGADGATCDPTQTRTPGLRPSHHDSIFSMSKKDGVSLR